MLFYVLSCVTRCMCVCVWQHQHQHRSHVALANCSLDRFSHFTIYYYFMGCRCAVFALHTIRIEITCIYIDNCANRAIGDVFMIAHRELEHIRKIRRE